MSTTGFGNYDQLSGVDPADIEQLQLSFDGNFDGFHINNGHIVPNGNAYVQRTPVSKPCDAKAKFRPEGIPVNAQKSAIFHSNVNNSNADNFWKDKIENGQVVRPENGIKLPSLDFRRNSSVWPKCVGNQVTYPLADGYLENLR